MDRLSDYIRHEVNLQAICTCGHVAVVDAQKLRRWFHCRNWNDAIDNVAGRLRCSVCWGRPRRIKAIAAKPDGPEWGPRHEHEWKDLVRRLRD